MSIGWSTICPGLVELFTVLAVTQTRGPGEWRPEWAERSIESVHPELGHQLLLTVTGSQQIGDDEVRYSFGTKTIAGEPVEDLWEEVCGQRKFTLQLKSRCLETLDHFWAFQILERVRSRLRRGSTLDALNALDVSLISAGPVVNASEVVDKRRLSVATMDLTLGTSVSDPNDDVPVGYVRQINLQTLFALGDPLPSPPNNGSGTDIPPTT